MLRTYTRRQALAALGLPLLGSTLPRRTILAGDEAPEGTPAGVPTSLCLPPEEGDDADTCRRGPVPAQVRIPAIEVDAPIEILETVGGVMQQPSDEVHVAWYKETARLGEVGNLHLAGHVNWWGIPEAVFFHLGELREGDEVLLLDEGETVFRYAIEWVRQESNLEPPREEVLGMTNYEAVTLMTCSGEWNSEISEYDARTVARAKRIPDDGTPDA
jgi:LPXTG-site transpeptidase (sortase) family protein